MISRYAFVGIILVIILIGCAIAGTAGEKIRGLESQIKILQTERDSFRQALDVCCKKRN